MPAGAAQNPLVEILVARIRAQGPITFADYMDTCLYHPEFGYYTRSDVSPRRDYYTSVDLHPMFGSLLARQLQEVWVVMGRPAPFYLVEAGAGTGDLARVILDFVAETFGDFYSALRYQVVEVSVARRREHAVQLARHIEAGRVESLGELPGAIACGCIFSNELLDALPVRRVSFSGGELREIHVNYEDARFQEVELALSTPVLGAYFTEQGISLHEEQQTEAGLGVVRWIREAGRRLGKGLVLTIDYGREARELYDQRHMRGTLLAYQRHRVGEDYYRAPGLQDLTAHVNFTAMDLWGGRAGLLRCGLVSQGNFLMALARKSHFAELESSGGGEADAARRRLMFKTLIYPEGMGEMFQVFVQRKGMGEIQLAGLEAL
jgi:SAM-dependent MidA family methyltransferase